jgi:acyl-CoA thioester hydrolase
MNSRSDAAGSARFEIAVEIAPDDIDELGHVNNVVYLRWVQEVASAHWQAEASEKLLASMAWIALRHEIDYKHPALPGDRIVATTWVGPVESVRFERFVDILRASDRKLLARSRSLWAPINRATGRVTRVSDELRSLFTRAYEAQQER